MKKILLLMSTFLIILVGCGSSADGETESAEVEQLEGDQIVYQGGWDPEASNDSAFADYIREYTGDNYVAQVGGLDNYVDKLMLDLASEVPMNFVTVPDESFGQILSNGLALDLKPYLEEYGQNILDGISDEAWASVTGPNGEIFGIPALQARTDVTAVMMYRKDILEKEGMEVPETTDEVVDTVCSLATKGYKTPWAINWGSAQYEYELRQSFGVGYWWNEKDGNLEYFGKDSRYLDYLNMAKEMYDCGGFGNDYETISQDDRNSRFIQGDAVFLTAPYWEAELQSDGLEAEGLEWKDVVGVQSVVEGPDGHKSAQLDGGASYEYSFIPAYMAPYAKQSIEFLNKLYSEDFILSAWYGEEGTDYMVNDDGVPFTLPGAEGQYGDGNWYKIGDFDKLEHESYLADLEYKQQQLDDGVDLDAKSRAELLSNEGADVGINDPMGTAITLDTWNDNQECANNKVLEFGDLYITGKKTEDDFEALAADLDNSCNFQAVTTEVQDWYKEK